MHFTFQKYIFMHTIRAFRISNHNTDDISKVTSADGQGRSRLTRSGRDARDLRTSAWSDSEGVGRFDRLWRSNHFDRVYKNREK